MAGNSTEILAYPFFRALPFSQAFTYLWGISPQVSIGSGPNALSSPEDIWPP